MRKYKQYRPRKTYKKVIRINHRATVKSAKKNMPEGLDIKQVQENKLEKLMLEDIKQVIRIEDTKIEDKIEEVMQ